VAFCCGTSSVTRFSVLREIGGFPVESLTEDYLLTLRLSEFGHQTVYLNERLSVGLAPEGLREYATQRSRWCLGLMQIVRGQYCPLGRNNRLSLSYRAGLVESFFYWAASFPFRLLCIVIPALYWLFGVRAVHADLADAIAAYFPYFISQATAVYWVSQGRVLPMLLEASQLLIVTDIAKATYAGLFRPKGQKFKVTPKGGRRDERVIQWRALALFATLAAGIVGGVGYTFFVSNTWYVEDGAVLTLIWTWYNLCVVFVCMFVCIEQPRYRRHERYPGRAYAILAIGDRAYNLSIADISVGGLLLRGEVSAEVGSAAMVVLPGRTQLPMVIVRKEPGRLALTAADADARDAMARHIHSGWYGAQDVEIKPLRVAKKIAERVAR
jgi:cellulose synthase (UDP-forming)